jgi:hypothetical protein
MLLCIFVNEGQLVYFSYFDVIELQDGAFFDSYPLVPEIVLAQPSHKTMHRLLQLFPTITKKC